MRKNQQQKYLSQFTTSDARAPREVEEHIQVSVKTDKKRAPSPNDPLAVPHSLIQSFFNKEKNGISCLTEYCARCRLKCEFQEVAPKSRGMFKDFAMIAIINGMSFDQGAGRTKKAAKIEAADIAFKKLLGIEAEDLHKEIGPTNVTVDPYGRMLVHKYDNSKVSQELDYKVLKENKDLQPTISLPDAQTVPTIALWDQPKNPIALFHEYCGKNGLDLSFNIAEDPDEKGFKATCLIGDEEIATEYALSKKEAKKQVAITAIRIALPQPQVKLMEENLRKSDQLEASSMAQPMNQRSVDVTKKTYFEELQNFCKENLLAFKVDVADHPERDGYHASVLITEDYVDMEIGFAVEHNKRDAREMACRAALQELEQREEAIRPVTTPQHDRLANMVIHHYLKLMEKNPGFDVSMPYIAAFVLQRDETDTGKVVAMGTGSACLRPPYESSNGRVLHDSYAIVIARRAFMKYLYKELRLYFGGSTLHSIFRRVSPDSLRLTLSKKIIITMFLTGPPSGDGVKYSQSYDGPLSDHELYLLDEGIHEPDFDESVPELGALSMKPMQGGYIKNPYNTSGDSNSMSCSDKMTKWNMVGLQGALLSAIIDPIYMDQVILARQFDHPQLTRAICCRLSLQDLNLPDKYYVIHPTVTRMTKYDPNLDVEDHTTMSFNWSEDDKEDMCIEVVDGKTGLSLADSPFRANEKGASRLCKAAMLHRFRDVMRMAGKFDMAEIPTYQEAKMACEEYQNVKQTFEKQMVDQKYGFWRHLYKNAGNFHK